jgi:hypothetical protein
LYFSGWLCGIVAGKTTNVTATDDPNVIVASVIMRIGSINHAHINAHKSSDVLAITLA